jgi:hypothetical protein
MKMKVRVFERDGNRFIVPGFWTTDDDPNWPGMDHSTLSVESMLFSVVVGCVPKTEWLEVETDEKGHGFVPHIDLDLQGRQFANGAVRVWAISGPLFDQEVGHGAV